VPLGDFRGTQIRRDTLSPGRAFVAAKCHAASDAGAAADIMQSRDGFRVGDVAIENLSEAEALACRRYQRSAWQAVPVAADRGTVVRLGAVQGPAFVVLNDSFYPGWVAGDRISGQPLEIKAANINFRALFLPEARSYDIAFHYRPYWLSLSLLMALISAAAWCGLIAFTVLRAKVSAAGRQMNARSSAASAP
jgi:hypothetical protein